MKMHGVRVSVCLLLMGFLYPCTSHPHCPQSPHQAEWQTSGLAKWWNDDPIIRSDSKMRGIRQRLHTPLCLSLSCSLYLFSCGTVLQQPASWANDDWFAWEGSQEATIDLFLFSSSSSFGVLLEIFIYSCICGMYQDTLRMAEAISGIIHISSSEDGRPEVLYSFRNESIDSLSKWILIE